MHDRWQLPHHQYTAISVSSTGPTRLRKNIFGSYIIIACSSKSQTAHTAWRNAWIKGDREKIKTKPTTHCAVRNSWNVRKTRCWWWRRSISGMVIWLVHPPRTLNYYHFASVANQKRWNLCHKKKDVRDQMSYAEFLIKMLMVKWWSWIENHRRSDENVANADNWQSFSMRCNKNTGFGENNHSFSTRLALESSTRWIDKILWTRGIFDVVSCLGVYCHCTMYVYVSVCVCICNNTERFATCAIGHLSMSSCQ